MKYSDIDRTVTVEGEKVSYDIIGFYPPADLTIMRGWYCKECGARIDLKYLDLHRRFHSGVRQCMT